MSLLPVSSTRTFVCGWVLLFIVCLLVALLGPVWGGSWTGTLQDGSMLRVDPDSHRAMRYYKGDVIPLWDGIHRLKDGSVVTIRDGQAVPTEAMMDSWVGESGFEPSMHTRYCNQLVRKVCGFHDECRHSQPCILARQLLSMERKQQRRTPVASGSWPHVPSSDECRDALVNSAFSACGSSTPGSEQTVCSKLVERVCGNADQCAAHKACNPTRQLLQIESDERIQRP